MLGANTARKILDILCTAIGLIQNFLTIPSITELFRYIYNVTQTISTVLRSTYTSKSLSASDVIVHDPHRNLSVTLSPPMSSNNAPSSRHLNQYHCFHLCPTIDYYRNLNAFLQIHHYVVMFEILIIPNLFLLPEVMFAH
jgi:hypothetical protein